MNPIALVLNSLLAGVHASAIAVVFTAPRAYLLPTLVCGFGARLVRDGSIAAGISPPWATLLAAATAVFIAVTVTPRRAVPPVVLVAAVVQLGAGSAVFSVIIELLRVSTLEGPELADASIRLTSSLGRAFTSFVAIALGLQLGITLTRANRTSAR